MSDHIDDLRIIIQGQQAEIARLKAEVGWLKRLTKEQDDSYQTLLSERERLKAEVERLEKAWGVTIDQAIRFRTERDAAQESARMAEERVARLAEGAKVKDAKIGQLMALLPELIERIDLDNVPDEDMVMAGLTDIEDTPVLARRDLLARARGEVDNG